MFHLGSHNQIKSGARAACSCNQRAQYGTRRYLRRRFRAICVSVARALANCPPFVPGFLSTCPPARPAQADRTSQYWLCALIRVSKLSHYRCLAFASADRIRAGSPVQSSRRFKHCLIGLGLIRMNKFKLKKEDSTGIARFGLTAREFGNSAVTYNN